MDANQPIKPATDVYAQGVESCNRCPDYCAESEVFDNTGGGWRAGLTRASVARFWSKVQRENGCWLWTGSTIGRATHRYGQFHAGRFPGGRQDVRYAHRVAYELTHGSIPAGLVVRHKCDVPRCCNPDHLEIGTQPDNLQDARDRGRLDESLPRPGAWLVPEPVRRAAIATRGNTRSLRTLAQLHGYQYMTLYMIARRHRLTLARTA
jgi:hypothetical protein